MKSKDNQLMWEAYVNGGNPAYQDELTTPNDGSEFGMEDAEGVVMEFEPEVELEIEEEPMEDVDEVLYSDLKKLSEYAQKLLGVCGQVEFDCWMKAKLVKASDYVSDVWHRLDAKADFANDGIEQSDNISL